MAITSTSRLGLTKPDDAEPADVSVLNVNADKLDGAVGIKLVNDGVGPTLPGTEKYEGMALRENGSGKQFVFKGGAFIQTSTKFGVWNYTTDLTAIATATVWELGTPVVNGSAGNTLAAGDVTINGKALEINTPGVYAYLTKCVWSSGAGSWRRFVETVVTPTAIWETRQSGGTDDDSMSVRGWAVVNTGQIQSIKSRVYQTSGGALNITSASILLVRLS